MDFPADGRQISPLAVTDFSPLDSAEVARWAKPADQQALDRLHGYGTGRQNPSVIHLNGLAVNAALAEIVAWLSGARPPAQMARD